MVAHYLHSFTICFKAQIWRFANRSPRMTDATEITTGSEANFPELRHIKPFRFPDEESDSDPSADGEETRMKRPFSLPPETGQSTISFLPPVFISAPTNRSDGLVKTRLVIRCPLCMVLFEGIRAFYHHLRHFRHAQLFPPGMTYVTVMCLLDEGMPSSGSNPFLVDSAVPIDGSVRCD